MQAHDRCAAVVVRAIFIVICICMLHAWAALLPKQHVDANLSMRCRLECGSATLFLALQCNVISSQLTDQLRVTHHKYSIEDEVISNGCVDAVTDCKMPRVCILLMERQQGELCCKPIPVSQLPPGHQQLW